MDIAIDFDGTCVKHRYPDCGEDCAGAVRVLQALVRQGHRLILNTMRNGVLLDDAVAWFRRRNIPLYGVNLHPSQLHAGLSPNKVLADLYIDDRGLGIPLVCPDDEPPYVDWAAVEILLTKMGLLA